MGEHFFEKPLCIREGSLPANISIGTRIGIDNSGLAKDYPYRFWMSKNPFVSR